MSPTALGVIPARYASRRFPGKALAPIDGVPMILRVLRNVEQARSVERVLVATDDARIAAVVRGAGGHVVMTSAGLASGTDRVWAAIGDARPDIVVNVQGDEPLLPGSVVDLLVDALASGPGFDISTPVVRVPRSDAAHPDVVTVARDEHGTAHYFSRSVIPSHIDPVLRHIGVYAYRLPALERFVGSAPSTLEVEERLEQLRALSAGLKITAVEVDVPCQAVDRPGDVAAVEQLLAGSAHPGSVALVVLDVDGVLTDGTIAYLADHGQLLNFDVKDGYGVVALRRHGIGVAVLSSRDSPALHRRAEELGITQVRVGVADKAAELRQLALELDVPLSSVCYVGDDDPDVPAMALAGVSAAPADASLAARSQATTVLQHAGGRGAVRELADLLLAQGVPHRRQAVNGERPQ